MYGGTFCFNIALHKSDNGGGVKRYSLVQNVGSGLSENALLLYYVLLVNRNDVIVSSLYRLGSNPNPNTTYKLMCIKVP